MNGSGAGTAIIEAHNLLEDRLGTPLIGGSTGVNGSRFSVPVADYKGKKRN